MLFETANLGPFIVATILVGLLFIVGFIACCIGAIAVAIFTLFYGYFVIDKSAQPADSISQSFTLVKEQLRADPRVRHRGLPPQRHHLRPRRRRHPDLHGLRLQEAHRAAVVA